MPPTNHVKPDWATLAPGVAAAAVFTPMFATGAAITAWALLVKFDKNPMLEPALGFSAGIVVGLIFSRPALGLHACLSATHRRGMSEYVVCGGAVSLVLGAMLQLWDQFAFTAGAGAATMLIFWLIRRPDRDASANPASTKP